MKKNLSLFLIAGMLFSLFSFANISATAAETIADKTVDYSIGTLKAGSYEGYAFIDGMNYADLASFNAAGHLLSMGTEGTNGNLTFVNGKPVLSKLGATNLSSFAVSIVAPETSNGISLPTSAPMYTQAQYSLGQSDSATNIYITSGAQGQTQYQTGTGNSSVANQISFQYKPTSSGTISYKAKPNFYNADNKINLRTLHQLGGTAANSKIWIWAWNPDYTTPISRPATPDINGLYSAYGATATQVNQVKFEIGKAAAAGKILTVQSVKIIEQYEMLFRDVISQVENGMFKSGDTINSVQNNLTLPTSVTGLDLGFNASVAWSSDNSAILVDGTTGIVTSSTTPQTVNLTATYTIKDALDSNPKVKTIVYPVFVGRPASNQEIVEAAADSLTWADLSSESVDSVKNNLTLPTQKSGYGTAVSIAWEIVNGASNLAISGASGVITPGDNSIVSATIRAKLTYLGITITKDFPFTILMGAKNFYYVNENFAAQGTGDVTDPNITCTSPNDTDSFIKYVNGTGIQLQGVSTTAAKASIISIDLLAKSTLNNLQNEYNNFESNTVIEFTANATALSTSSSYETQILLKNSAGKLIAFYQFTGGNKSTAATSATINLKQGGAWGAAMPSSMLTKYRSAYNATTGELPNVNFRIIYNRLTNKYDTYMKLDSDADYTLYYANGSPNEAVAAGDPIGKIELTTTVNFPRASIINLKNLKVYTNTDIIKAYITNQLSINKILNGQLQNTVTGDLDLYSVPPHYGTTLSWQVISDYPANKGPLFTSTGKMIPTLTDGEIYHVSVSPIINFTNSAFSEAVPAPITYLLTAVGVDKSSLAYSKTTTLTGATADVGSDKGYANDGFAASSFVTTGAENSFSLTIDLGKNTLFSNLALKEGLINGNYNIGSYTVDASTDKKTWNTLFTGTDVGAVKNLVTSSPYTEYRYLRLTVNSKKVLANKVAIAEIDLTFVPDTAYKLSKDIESLEAPPATVSGDFYLQGVGTISGTPITWVSKNTGVLSVATALETNAASPNYNKYKVTYTKPAVDTPITIAVTIGTFTNNYSIIAAGTNAGTSQNKPSSSGGGGGGFVSYNNLNKPTETPVPTVDPTGIFTDLASAPWAVDYINTLYEKGIINGDGAGHFNPQNSVTREEFVKMLVLSLGLKPNQDAEVPFKDVLKTNWSYPYIAIAYEKGIISGISEDNFGFGKEIIRQDVCVMISRALDKLGIELNVRSVDFSFNDKDSIGSYANYSVETMKQYGIVSGDEQGNFNPHNNAIRASIAKILGLVIQQLEVSL